jgi:hypothetical protein
MKAPFSHLSHLSHLSHCRRRRRRSRRRRRHRRHCASSREAWGSAAHWSVGSTPCVHREGGRGAGVVLDPRDRGKGHGRWCGVVCVPLFLGGARSAADGRLIAGVTKAGHVLVMWGAGAEGNTSCVRGPLRVWGVYRVHAGRGTVAIKHHASCRTAILRPPNILHATARAGMVCVRHVRVFAAAPPPQRKLKSRRRSGPASALRVV